ncbi:MAG: ATP-grasp domain-containing protein [Flavobacteriales bacterium]|jgi:glutathione synthase/RimK-type ligase-like ATP-grasp enzyme|nr:ATP-grasp domain-containing protein [Flavobacteriales bacterium]MDG1439227.1 ATP-grasp domain-containing protein [Flavobacteriales bacterium]MDG1798638.1 ATP-grasp domain-containing protein [Flavobacteriales bacterium]
MKDYDVVILTDSRYVQPNEKNQYIENVLKEDGLLIEALNNLGLKTIKKDWNDSNFNWNSTKTAVFRSTWDYFDKFSIFQNWLSQVQNKCALINSYEQIKWNLDKHYLQDLKNWSLPIPKSVFINKMSGTKLKDIATNMKWNHIVVKPTVSGAAKNTFQLKDQEIENFQTNWIRLTNEEDFIVQEFQKNIIKSGEIAVMLFGGKYSHAVLKKAKKGDFRVQDDFGGTVETITPSKEIIDLAEKAIKKLNPTPLYCRVDVILNNQNKAVIIELELIEPELWFRFKITAADKLAMYIKEFINKLHS